MPEKFRKIEILEEDYLSKKQVVEITADERKWKFFIKRLDNNKNTQLHINYDGHELVLDFDEEAYFIASKIEAEYKSSATPSKNDSVANLMQCEPIIDCDFIHPNLTHGSFQKIECCLSEVPQIGDEIKLKYLAASNIFVIKSREIIYDKKRIHLLKLRFKVDYI